MKNVFIIGSKGIPSNYGGFETFVDKLTEYNLGDKIKYHVSCLASDTKEFEYNNARCFNINVPNIGPAKAVYYDIAALKESIQYIENNNIKNATIYILACRIGPFIGHYKKKMKKLGITLFVNPDGHEWKRAKWNAAIRKYWKYSEKLMVKHADLLVCDSINIEKYIISTYSKYKPNTTYIAYGADVTLSKYSDNDKEVVEWFESKKVQFNNYYLIVGRFVPENNYETMIREFMESKTTKDLVIITNVEKNNFFEKLSNNTGFVKDDRIKFVGTVYNQELLKKIREQAYGYIHGHEVGGTNPSLLEALASTKLNLLLDVGFNREVGMDSALYWEKEKKSLSILIDHSDNLNQESINFYSSESSNQVLVRYSWEKINSNYIELFYECGCEI